MALLYFVQMSVWSQSPLLSSCHNRTQITLINQNKNFQAWWILLFSVYFPRAHGAVFKVWGPIHLFEKWQTNHWLSLVSLFILFIRFSPQLEYPLFSIAHLQHLAAFSVHSFTDCGFAVAKSYAPAEPFEPLFGLLCTLTFTAKRIWHSWW